MASQDDVILCRRENRRGTVRVVLVCGCFDLLHPGHIRLLEQARSLGDTLVVAVESDASVRARAAAANRPITPAAERTEILAALASVDFVFETETDEASVRHWLAHLAPDIVAAGAETAGRALQFPVGEGEASAAGAQFVRIPLEPGHSTSRLVERIAQLPS